MFYDHDGHAMKAGNRNEIIANVLCRKELLTRNRAARFLQRQVVVGRTDVTFLLKRLANDKLLDQERVESFDHLGKTKNQLVPRFVLGQLRNRRCFTLGFVVGRCGFDKFSAIAGVGGR